MAKSSAQEKRYYSISEVARMTGLEPYVLRYWEKEFPTLQPKKNRGGSRQYTTKDIELINRIIHLRTKEKLTIAGTRNRLTLRKPSESSGQLKTRARAKTLISQIKKDVEDLLKFFP